MIDSAEPVLSVRAAWMLRETIRASADRPTVCLGVSTRNNDTSGANYWFIRSFMTHRSWPGQLLWSVRGYRTTDHCIRSLRTLIGHLVLRFAWKLHGGGSHVEWMAFSSNRRGKSRTMRPGWMRNGRRNGIFARHGFRIVRCWPGRILKSVRFGFSRRWRRWRSALPIRLSGTVATWSLSENSRAWWVLVLPPAQLQARAGSNGSCQSLGHEPEHAVLPPVVS